MKSIFGMAVLALLSSVFCWAQQQPDQSAGFKLHVGTVKGCVEGSRGDYLLREDPSGVLFRLVGDNGQLKSHLGQEVLVTGQLPGGGPAPSAVGETQSNPTETGSPESSTTANIIQVSKIETVLKVCAAAQPPASH